MFLQNEVDGLRRNGSGEEFMEDSGTQMEGRVGENFIGFAREYEIFKGLLHYYNIGDVAGG